MAAGEIIGTAKCPFCEANGVKLKESKNGGAAGTCGNCGCQVFGKTPKAVGAARARATAKPASADDEHGEPAERSFGAEIFGEGK